jgi:NAD(P)-dependent dehydrogenase (short-subunit alcohol dehydrogenase family)
VPVSFILSLPKTPILSSGSLINGSGIGVAGTNDRSTTMSAQQFDLVTNINYRGVWLSSRSEIAQMLKQEPLPTHDGRVGNRGAIVNIASQLGVVSRPNAREYFEWHSLSFRTDLS